MNTLCHADDQKWYPFMLGSYPINTISSALGDNLSYSSSGGINT